MSPTAPDLSDSTDWLPTSLPSLAPVDASLRCQVCKDFFASPVITSCAHTFCSLCIRRCLALDGKCPACRAADQETKLRRNWAVQEMVDAFVGARTGVLALAMREGKGEEGERPKKRRRTEGGNGGEVEGGLSTRTRSAARRVLSSSPVHVVDLDEKEEGAEDVDYEPEDGLVPCPICKSRMKAEAVFAHLDNCDGEEKNENPRNTRSRGPATFDNRLTPQNPTKPPPSRLPQLNYSLMTDNQLKKKLKELGIPNFGNKPLLIRRHTEWQNLWNSNIDSTKPRTKRELLSDLDAWERSQGGLAREGGAAGGAVMRKDFDGKEWAKKNAEQFGDLISQARKGRGEKTKTVEQEEDKTKTGEQEEDTKKEPNGEKHPTPDAPPSKSNGVPSQHEETTPLPPSSAKSPPQSTLNPYVTRWKPEPVDKLRAYIAELNAQAVLEVPADPIVDVDNGEER